MAQRTASDVSSLLTSIRFTASELSALWIRLGSIYEKTQKFDQALGAYMRCIEADVDNPVPLYRFVYVSRTHRPAMLGHCLKLLGIHFLTFLTEYESTRLIAIAESEAMSERDKIELEKRRLRAHNNSKTTYLTNEQMASATTEIASLEADLTLAANFSLKSRDGRAPVPRIVPKQRRVLGRKRGRNKEKPVKQDESPSPAKKRKGHGGEMEEDGDGEGDRDGEGVGEGGSNLAFEEMIPLPLSLTPKDSHQDGIEPGVPGEQGDLTTNRIEDEVEFDMFGEIADHVEGLDAGDIGEDGRVDEDGRGEGENDADGGGKGQNQNMDGTKNVTPGVESEGGDPGSQDQNDAGLDGSKIGEDGEGEGDVEEGEGEGEEVPFRAFALGTKKYPRFTIENELRAIALWATMLKETGDELSFCCIMLPMLSAWLVNLRGGGYYSQGGASKSRARERTLEEFIQLRELQTNKEAIAYVQPSWLDDTQGSMGRLVTALCEFVSVEDVVGKEILEDGASKCQLSLEKLNIIGPSCVPSSDTQKLQFLLDNCTWIIKRRQSQPGARRSTVSTAVRPDRAPRVDGPGQGGINEDDGGFVSM